MKRIPGKDLKTLVYDGLRNSPNDPGVRWPAPNSDRPDWQNSEQNQLRRALSNASPSSTVQLRSPPRTRTSHHSAGHRLRRPSAPPRSRSLADLNDLTSDRGEYQ